MLRVVTAGANAAWEASVVRACQRHELGAEVIGRCHDLGDLLAAAAGGLATVALVASDVRWLDRESVDALTRAGTTVVGVVDDGDDAAERRLRQVGVTRIAAASSPPEALLDVAREGRVDPLEPDPRATTDSAELGDGPGRNPVGANDAGAGPLVVVWGPKGSAGSTTVALNLAFESAALLPGTALVDADVYGGAVAQSLGLVVADQPGIAGVARLASRGELDTARLWRATLRASEHGPRVLAGLQRAALWTEIRPATWELLLDLFASTFPLTVIDVAACLEEDEELLYDQVRLRRNAVSRLALQHADVVVAVARADPVGLHHFVRAFESLRELVPEPGRVRVVVNQVRSGTFGGPAPQQIRGSLERYLGVEPVAMIPYDRPAIDAAGAAGKALREVKPGAPAQVAIARFARELMRPGGVQQAARPLEAVRRRRTGRLVRRGA